jgi:hypothetical protein
MEEWEWDLQNSQSSRSPFHPITSLSYSLYSSSLPRQKLGRILSIPSSCLPNPTLPSCSRLYSSPFAKAPMDASGDHGFRYY